MRIKDRDFEQTAFARLLDERGSARAALLEAKAVGNAHVIETLEAMLEEYQAQIDAALVEAAKETKQ